jgi:hypothetical protein
MSEGTGVPFGMGVLVAESPGLSVVVLGAVTGIVLERVEVESFDGESSLISLASCLKGVAGSRLRRKSGDKPLRGTTRLILFEDFRRALEVVAGLLDEAMVEDDG